MNHSRTALACLLIPALALVVAVYVLRHRRKVAQGRQEG